MFGFELEQLLLQVADQAEYQFVGFLVGDDLMGDVAADILGIGIHRARPHARTEVDVELQRGSRIGQQRAEQRDDVWYLVVKAPGHQVSLMLALRRDGHGVAARHMEQGQMCLACGARTGLARQLGRDVVGIVGMYAATIAASEEARHFGISAAAQSLGLTFKLLTRGDNRHVAHR